MRTSKTLSVSLPPAQRQKVLSAWSLPFRDDPGAIGKPQNGRGEQETFGEGLDLASRDRRDRRGRRGERAEEEEQRDRGGNAGCHHWNHTNFFGG